MLSIVKAGHGPCYTQKINAESDQAAKKDTSSGRGITYPALSKTQTNQIFRWRFPTWWSATVWEVYSAPQPGWNYGLRIYRIVSRDSAIIQSVREGDTNAVMELFSSREASPFDRDQDNNSLLQVSLNVLLVSSQLNLSSTQYSLTTARCLIRPRDVTNFL